VEKDNLNKLGTVRDDKSRVTLQRVDDEHRKSYIAKARDWIYRKANIIKSTKVEALLHPKSWVPTVVSRQHRRNSTA
jgi:hypothetical protein